MHILVVSGTFHPEPGGPPTYLRNLLPALQQRGHQITVVTYTDLADSFCDSQTYGYPVWRITRQQPIPKRLLQFIRWVLQHGKTADVMFISDYGLPAAVANLRLGIPSVIKNVSDFTWEFATRRQLIPAGLTIDEFQTAQLPLRVRFLRRLQAWYTNAATLVLAPSHYSASLPIGWGIPKEKTRVVYNAIDRAHFENLPSVAALRTALGFADVPQIVAVARLTPWKHFDLIIAAFQQLQAQLPAAQLTIIGDGPSRPDLDALLAETAIQNVTLTGALPHQDVARYLKAADLYVQFSTYEGLPHTVIEAMIAQTPCVVSNIGGNPEVVAHEQTGLLVPALDADALAQALLRMLTDTKLAADCVANANQQLEKFAWDTLVDRTEAVLLEAAQR